MGVTKVLIYFKSHSATPGPNGILLHQSKYNQLSQLPPKEMPSIGKTLDNRLVGGEMSNHLYKKKTLIPYI